MLIFPQLSTGAITQYPTNRTLSQRTLQSVMEDGTIIALADVAACYLQWRAAFKDLSDPEASALGNFFAATQGNVQPFLFLDPLTNLLLWSEDFSQNVWQTTGLSFDSGIVDPFGGAKAFCAHNNSQANLAVVQQSQIPGAAQVCFSVYLRADNPASTSLAISAGGNSQSVTAALTSAWQRFSVAGNVPAATACWQFSISAPAGTSLEIFGPQVDAQVNPSAYVTSTGQSGVYAGARFDMKQMDMIATGPNRSACVMSIRCNLPGGE